MAYLEELLPEFRKGAKIRIKSWQYGFYLQTEGGVIVDQNMQHYNLGLIDLKCNNWEFYKEPEPDWDSIIKNKCLCWFWDKREDYKIAGILEKYFNLNNISRFIANIYEEEAGFRYCRPVRRDEVTFYEDKKDD